MRFALALVVASSLTPATVVPADEAPRGMVAFVDGPSCPSGWTPATIAMGRLLVGTDEATAIGHAVGEPLAALEDRSHTHTLAGATLDLPFKSISAADGGNNNGAAAGAQALTGNVQMASSALPFIQLTACVSP